MATCSPGVLLLQAGCYNCLSRHQLEVLKTRMLADLTSQDSLTPSQLLSPELNSLTDNELRVILAQLACVIVGG